MSAEQGGKQELLGRQFLIFLPKHIRENNYLGGQSSFFDRSNPNNVFSLEILKYVTFLIPSSASTQFKISWTGVFRCVDIVQRT